MRVHQHGKIDYTQYLKVIFRLHLELNAETKLCGYYYWGQRENSGVKSTCCPCRGSGSPSPIWWLMQNSRFRGSNLAFWLPQVFGTHIQTNTHPHKIKINILNILATEGILFSENAGIPYILYI